MIYQKHCNTRNGMIIFEILMAMTLGVIFVATTTSIYFIGKDLFESSIIKSEYLDMFVAEKDLLPKLDVGSEYHLGQIHKFADFFGNEWVENKFEIYATSTGATSTIISGSFPRLLELYSIDSRVASNGRFMTSPNCSPFFVKNRVVGSYEYISARGQQYSPSSEIRLENVTVSPISIPVGSGITITDMKIQNDIAYISADSSRQSDPDIYVVDISDTGSARILSSINTGPGMAALDVFGNHIFGAARSTVSQLHVVKMNALNDLALVKRYSLVPLYATATLPYASVVKFYNGKIFLGTEKWEGDEFEILDISNAGKYPIDTFEPQKIYGNNIDSKVNDIYIHSDHLYLSSSNMKQLTLFDITNLFNVLESEFFSPSGWSRQEGKVANMFEGDVFFGRTSGGFNIVADHEVFSWENFVTGLDLPTNSLDRKGGVYGLLADKDFVYLGTRELGKELQIFDHDFATSTATTIALPLGVEKMTCYRSSVYVLGHGAPVIYKIDFI